MRNLLACMMLLALTAATAHAQTTLPASTLAVTNTFAVTGNGSWDYLSINPDTELLYVTRGGHLQVIDISDETIEADLPKCGAHGVVLIPELNKGFTSDGPANTATAFDLKTNKVLYTVPCGHNPDAIIYDPASKKVFAFDGRSNDATVINPAAEGALAVVAHIPLDGKPEFAASDGAGRVYVNIEDRNEVQVIDSKSMTIRNTWKIEGQSPSGLAIDAETHHLFIGCDGKMVVLNGITGKTLSSPAIGDGVDACSFDPELKLAFASCGDGTLAVIKETSPQRFETVQTIHTRGSARTMALDVSTHCIYLPYGETLPLAPGQHYPGIKPGSFGIVVVSPPEATTQPTP